jgi:hypothetical protein
VVFRATSAAAFAGDDLETGDEAGGCVAQSTREVGALLRDQDPVALERQHHVDQSLVGLEDAVREARHVRFDRKPLHAGRGVAVAPECGQHPAPPLELRHIGLPLLAQRRDHESP